MVEFLYKIRVDNQDAASEGRGLSTLKTQKSMKKILAAFLIFSSISLTVIALGVGGSGTTSNPNADAFNQGQDIDNSSAIVQLKGDPLSINSATKPAPGKKIDFNHPATRSYRAQLSAGRND